MDDLKLIYYIAKLTLIFTFLILFIYSIVNLWKKWRGEKFKNHVQLIQLSKIHFKEDKIMSRLLKEFQGELVSENSSNRELEEAAYLIGYKALRTTIVNGVKSHKSAMILSAYADEIRSVSTDFKEDSEALLQFAMDHFSQEVNCELNQLYSTNLIDFQKQFKAELDNHNDRLLYIGSKTLLQEAEKSLTNTTQNKVVEVSDNEELIGSEITATNVSQIDTAKSVNNELTTQQVEINRIRETNKVIGEGIFRAILPQCYTNGIQLALRAYNFDITSEWDISDVSDTHLDLLIVAFRTKRSQRELMYTEAFEYLLYIQTERKNRKENTSIHA